MKQIDFVCTEETSLQYTVIRGFWVIIMLQTEPGSEDPLPSSVALSHLLSYKKQRKHTVEYHCCCSFVHLFHLVISSEVTQSLWTALGDIPFSQEEAKKCMEVAKSLALITGRF